MSNGLLATGTLFKIDDGAGNFVTVAELRDIQAPELTTTQHDASTHNAGPNAWDEVIPGRLRSGEMTFDVNFIPTDATHNTSAGLIYLWKNRIKRAMKLIYPDGTTDSWSGYVVKVGRAAPVDGILAGSISVKADGTITLG